MANCDVLFLDECTMISRWQLAALDILLRQARGISKRFGGCFVVFIGDLRQIGPIVVGGTSKDSFEACWCSCDLAANLVTHKLTQPVRDAEDTEWSTFVRAVGDNAEPRAVYNRREGVPVRLAHRSATHAEPCR